MKKNVPAEWNKYQKGVCYPGPLVIGAEKLRDNFRSNVGGQKVKTLVLTVDTNAMCFYVRN